MLKHMTDAQGYRNHSGEPYVVLYESHRQTERLKVSEAREAIRILEAAIFEALVLEEETANDDAHDSRKAEGM